jgi:Protein of unknwon function (DUF3310)
MSAIDHPQHYNAHPSGMECIDLVEMLPFNSGNAIKYLWRRAHKGARLEDLRKARWYVERQRDSACALKADEPDEFATFLARACDGFDVVTAGAMIHIADSNWSMALRCIDHLIDAAE